MCKKYLLLCLFALALFFGCKPKQSQTYPLPNGSELVHHCVNRLTEVIVYDVFSPPVSSRIYAYSSLAFYEAIRFENGRYASILPVLKGFTPLPKPQPNTVYHFPAAAVKAFFNVAKQLTFSKDSLALTESGLLAALEQRMEPEVFERSAAFGDSIASGIKKRMVEDNYKKTRGMARYSVFKETGRWQQTPPDYMDAVEPYWNMIAPFSMDSAAQFKPQPPPPFSLDSTSIYHKQLMEVYAAAKNLNKEQDTIARYWDDNPLVMEHEGHMMYATKKATPNGHWMGIAAIASGMSKADIVKSSYAYALVAVSMFDSFIACWDEKYRSRMVRPISVIQEHFEQEWEPLLQTPPFPEYTSGHSSISAAAATVLDNLYGPAFAFTDTTELQYLGMQRSFKSFWQAANEASISRLYGGIHYRAALESGQLQGKQIASTLLSKLTKK